MTDEREAQRLADAADRPTWRAWADESIDGLRIQHESGVECLLTWEEWAMLAGMNPGEPPVQARRRNSEEDHGSCL